MGINLLHTYQSITADSTLYKVIEIYLFTIYTKHLLYIGYEVCS